MILSMIGQLSAQRQVSVSSGRIRTARESVGMPQRHTNKQAGLSTNGAWIMAGCPPGSWPELDGFSGN